MTDKPHLDRTVIFNNRKKGFEVRMRNDRYWFPYAKAEILRESDGLVSDARADPEPSLLIRCSLF